MAKVQHLKLGPNGDVAGAVKDLQGTPVLKANGQPWNHLNEVQTAMNGVENALKTLENSTSPAAQAAKALGNSHLGQVWAELGPGL